MASRSLSLHASALSGSEYELYTKSLADLVEQEDDDALSDEKHTPRDGDAYFENMRVGIREARAWMRGRYADVPVPEILKLFQPSDADTLTGKQFFAALRLVIHTQQTGEVDRAMAFVQAQPNRPISPSLSRSASPVRRPTSSSRPTSPTKKPPAPPPSHPALHRGPSERRRIPSALSQNSSASVESSNVPPLPESPAVRSTNPFLSRARSLNAAGGRPTPPPKAEELRGAEVAARDRRGAFEATTVKSDSGTLPPLPPRKQPPALPLSAPTIPPRHGSITAPSMGHSATYHHSPSLPSSAAIPHSFSVFPPTPGAASPFGNAASPFFPPPKPSTPSSKSVPPHVTTPLMQQSLQASKTGLTMKRAEAGLERERVMQVLKSSGRPTHGSSASISYSGGHSFSASKSSVSRSISPTKRNPEGARWPPPSQPTTSSASSSGSSSRERPPVPTRKPSISSATNMSNSSWEQVAGATLGSSSSRTPQRVLGHSNPFRTGLVDVAGSPAQEAFFEGSPFESPPSTPNIPSPAPPTHPDRDRIDRLQGLRRTSDAESPSNSPRRPSHGSAAISRGPDSATGRKFPAPGSSALEDDASPPPTPTSPRVVRSKSMHHPTPPPVPPPRRKRPESVQLSPSSQNIHVAYVQDALAASSLSSPQPPHNRTLSRHMSYSSPGSSRRENLESSPLSNIQKTLAALQGKAQPRLEALHNKAQPKLDAARYKAEAGLSRRGFVNMGGRLGEEAEEGLMRGGTGGALAHEDSDRGQYDELPGEEEEEDQAWSDKKTRKPSGPDMPY